MHSGQLETKGLYVTLKDVCDSLQVRFLYSFQVTPVRSPSPLQLYGIGPAGISVIAILIHISVGHLCAEPAKRPHFYICSATHTHASAKPNTFPSHCDPRAGGIIFMNRMLQGQPQK